MRALGLLKRVNKDAPSMFDQQQNQVHCTNPKHGTRPWPWHHLKECTRVIAQARMQPGHDQQSRLHLWTWTRPQILLCCRNLTAVLAVYEQID